MLMEIIVTVWLSLFLLGVVFFIIGGLLNNYKTGEVLLCIGCVVAFIWGISTLLLIFGFAIYLVWS